MNHASPMLRRGFAFGIILLVLMVAGLLVRWATGTLYSAKYTVEMPYKEFGTKKQAEQLVSIITNNTEFTVIYSYPFAGEDTFQIGLELKAARPNDLPKIDLFGLGGSQYLVKVSKSGRERTPAMKSAQRVVEDALDSFPNTHWKREVTRHESMWK